MTEDIPPADEPRRSRPSPVVGTRSRRGSGRSPIAWPARAMTYVGANLATLTTCGATPTDMACGQNSRSRVRAEGVPPPAHRPRKRPPSRRALGASSRPRTAAPSPRPSSTAIYAVLSSPEFLYRTEYRRRLDDRRPAHPVRARERDLVLRDGRSARRRCSSQPRPEPARRQGHDPDASDAPARDAGRAREPRSGDGRLLPAHRACRRSSSTRRSRPASR